MLASSVDRDVNGSPVGRNWLRQWFQTLNLPFTFTKRFMKNSPFIFTPCLPHHSHPVHWDQTKELVCQSLGSRPTHMQELFTLAPCLLDNLLLFVRSAISVATFKKHLRTHLLTWPFPPQTPARPMILGPASSILMLNTNSAVTPLSLTLQWILGL